MSSLQGTVAGIAIAHDHIFVAAVDSDKQNELTAYTTTIYVYTLSGAESTETDIRTFLETDTCLAYKYIGSAFLPVVRLCTYLSAFT